MNLVAPDLTFSPPNEALGGAVADDAGLAGTARRRPDPYLAAADAQHSQGTISQARLCALVTSVVTTPQTWRPVVRFSPEHRWFSRIALTADYEIWLLSWLPGQRTGFHDHGEACGAFAVAAGELRETLAVGGLRRVRHRMARQGSLTPFGSGHVHDVGNVAADPAVSVHAYSPPLAAMRRYEMTAAGLTPVRTDRALVDW